LESSAAVARVIPTRSAARPCSLAPRNGSGRRNATTASISPGMVAKKNGTFQAFSDPTYGTAPSTIIPVSQ
jgi:hypothetical protein